MVTAEEEMAEHLCGHGTHGEQFILLRPRQFPDSVLANLKDVLIRFDIVEVTN